MASWILVPCLGDDGLTGEFNRVGPKRSKASDGSVGDTAHAGNESDHNPDETGSTHDEDSDNRNEVHAKDVTAKGPWLNGMTMKAATRLIADRHRSGADQRLQGIIYNREICWEPEWKWKEYSGSNPHTEHAHFSARYDTGKLENDTRSFGLVEKWGDDVSEQDVTNALNKFFARDTNSEGVITSRIGRDALDQGIPSGVTGDKVQAWIVLKELGQQIMQVKSTLNTLANKDMTDEQAIINGVLAGLAGAEGAADTIADAVVAALPADIATDVANQILAKQGQAMVDAAGGEGGS
jgi:hypothetical protein